MKTVGKKEFLSNDNRQRRIPSKAEKRFTKSPNTVSPFRAGIEFSVTCRKPLSTQHISISRADVKLGKLPDYSTRIYDILP